MPRIFCLLFLFCCCIAICSTAFAEEEIDNQQEETQFALPMLKEVEVSGPYCGIYSLVACLDVYGITSDIQTLLIPEYVGSFQGSSDKELIIEPLKKIDG